MSLIVLREAQLAHGDQPLLDRAEFSLTEGERVGLIGRNGSGKSSLLRVLAGLDTLDDGTLNRQQNVDVAYVPQEPALTGHDTIFDAVAAAWADVRSLIEAHARGTGDLDRLQTQIEAQDGWNWQRRVNETLQHLRLAPDTPIAQLSGGQRKRVALAQALARQPHILLLDEPTNHLDLEAIRWLETLLASHGGAAVIVAHDRAFLDAVSTRIVELDRGRLSSYPGNFTQYQALKTEQLAQEATIAQKADRLLAQEEAWMRQGIQARRTRSQDRVRRLQQLRAERAARRNVVGQVRMAVDANVAGYQGKWLTQLQQAGFSYGEQPIVDALDTVVLRGDKVGIIGPNGVGKTTLLKLILGELEPTAGRIWRSGNLQVAYYDQMRSALKPEATLETFVNPGSQWIEIGDRRQHVKSYLRDFLFSPARAASPVSSLSGGERARLLLARLFARPANVLVLDEPTNDLDIDTLDLLEELLQEYAGTVFVVSHDRRFLDNVVTSLLVWDGPGQWREHAGAMMDWDAQGARWQALRAEPVPPGREKAATPPATGAPTPAPPAKRKKLSYREQQELDGLPDRIAALETEQNEIRAALSDGTLYKTDLARAIALQARDTDIEETLMQALERWEELGSVG